MDANGTVIESYEIKLAGLTQFLQGKSFKFNSKFELK